MKEWPECVPHNTDASINVDKFALLVEEFVQKGHPIILVLTTGTTTDCAMDNVDACAKALRSIKGYNLDNIWIHVDGAWCGPYSRFLQIAQE